MPRTLWSLLSTKPGLMGLGRGGWQPFKQWECPRIPRWGTQSKSLTLLFPPPPLPVQSQADAADEEDTSSMQELVQATDTQMETDDLEVTNNPNTTEDVQMQQPPTKDVPDQPAGDAVHTPPTNPSI